MELSIQVALEQNLIDEKFTDLQLRKQRNGYFSYKARYNEKQFVSINGKYNCQSFYQEALKEKECLDKLYFSKNVVKCYGVFEYKNLKCSILVIDYSEQTLQEKLVELTNTRQFIYQFVAEQWIFQLCHVLIEMNAMDIIHQHLTAQNILLTIDKQNKVELKLFNVSNHFNYVNHQSYQQQKNTDLPLEQQLNQNQSNTFQYPNKVNIYSIARIILQISEQSPIPQYKKEKLLQILQNYCYCNKPDQRIESYELPLLIFKQINLSNQNIQDTENILDNDIKFTQQFNNLNEEKSKFNLNWQVNAQLYKIWIFENSIGRDQVKNKQNILHAQKEIGMIYSLLNKYEKSHQYYRILTEFYEKNKNNNNEYIEVLCLIAQLYEIEEEPNRSIYYYEKALNVAKNIQSWQVPQILYNLAQNYYQIKAIKKAKQHCQESIDQIDKSNRIDLADYLNLMGCINHSQELYQEAIEDKLKSLSIYKQNENHKNQEKNTDIEEKIAHLQYGIGKTYEKMQKFNDALEYYGMAEAIFSKMNGNDDQTTNNCSTSIQQIQKYLLNVNSKKMSS